jgi:hypothetical protein
MSFFGDFWEFFLKKISALRAELGKKSKYCHFGEILALQYMSFWGDFGIKIKNNET